MGTAFLDPALLHYSITPSLHFLLPLLFVEFLPDQFFQLFHYLFGVRPFTANRELRSLPGSEHHQAHDAFAVDLFAFLFHPDLGTMTAGDPDEHRRGAGMQTETVNDRDLFLDLPP